MSFELLESGTESKLKRVEIKNYTIIIIIIFSTHY